MNILAIDIGSYSVKFIEMKPERKNFLLVDKQEIILDEVQYHYPNISDTAELQREIISNFIHKKGHEYKIIFQIPSEMITTRYLEIPGTSKKKAEMIIPFQLDENLPYSLSSSHFSSRISKNASHFDVLSNITQSTTFNDYYANFEGKDTQPTILTSEISVIQAYIEHIRMNETCCIVDMGHKTTKFYFIKNRQIVSNHISHVAGQTVNDVISKTYQISLDDAVIYKHANAFMLTDEQLNEVSPEQKEFALIMKQVFNPLISDLRRWEIGHRVKHGTAIDRIYILGGTSAINNLDNFIYYHLGIPVSYAPSITDFKGDYENKENTFLITKMMGIASRNPNSIINFLIGKYQVASSTFISLHSATFIGMRSLVLALIIIGGLSAEKILFLDKQEKALDSKIKTLIKRPNLAISNNDRKSYVKTPNRILNLLKKKNKIITDEVSAIYSSQDVNALKSLSILSKLLTNNPEVSLEKFTSNGTEVEAKFTSQNPEILNSVAKTLKDAQLPAFSVKYGQNQTTLSVTFEDQQ